VAEGFIHEIAKKVAGDRNLDFEGKKQAVRNAIDIYEKELAGGQTQTNIDAIVDEALARARSLVDVGKSGLVQATLRRAAEAMRREEVERRERYVAGITVLFNRRNGRPVAEFGSDDALRIWARSRQQRASHRIDRTAAEIIRCRFIR
jgi:hypothetical protein